MILPYSRIGPLLMLGRGTGKKILFQAQPGIDYIVTTENYAKCLMCSPFLAKILDRDLDRVHKYLLGEDNGVLESWVYQDIARCLLHLKEGAMRGQIEIKAPITVLVNRTAVDDAFRQEIALQTQSILDTLNGEKEPSELFAQTVGSFALSRIQKDPSLLDDQLLSLSFMYMRKGCDVCVNSH